MLELWVLRDDRLRIFQMSRGNYVTATHGSATALRHIDSFDANRHRRSVW
jgi:hypothetical protein